MTRTGVRLGDVGRLTRLLVGSQTTPRSLTYIIQTIKTLTVEDPFA